MYRNSCCLKCTNKGCGRCITWLRMKLHIHYLHTWLNYNHLIGNLIGSSSGDVLSAKIWFVIQHIYTTAFALTAGEHNWTHLYCPTLVQLEINNVYFQCHILVYVSMNIIQLSTRVSRYLICYCLWIILQFILYQHIPFTGNKSAVLIIS